MERFLGDGGMALLATFGVAFDGYGDGWAEAAWTPTEPCANPQGIVQGGVHGVVLDAAMNFAMLAALERGDNGATLEFHVSTMRPARVADPLRVRGEVVRLARSVAYLEAKIRNAEGELVSQATGTFIVRRREG
ncbi:MAG: hypothetical protein JWL73_3160 [Actinomycetia bacterium]|nr:hypothetical protein [Actinomycetes bacterium]